MKKLLLFSLFIVIGCSLTGYAQGVSSISQNFDGVCTSASGFPSSWLRYNPIAGTAADGQWVCDPANGRKNLSGSPTPGVSCSGVWSGTFHQDTSYLITPLLKFLGHDHAYLYFDAKADSIALGGKLKMYIYRPDSPYSFQDTSLHMDVSDSLAPIITIADSGTWVTHHIDLTPYILMPPYNFYVAFMYTSNTTTGSRWYIDNVYTSYYRLDVPVVEQEALPVTVRGISTPENITLSFGNVIRGTWELSIFDMMGRKVYGTSITQSGYIDMWSITDSHLAPGCYVAKMTNGTSYGTTKIMVQ